VGYSVGTRQF